MRNLKKLLALVLAMMMAFSLMLTANAANPVRDYPDADQADEAFEEAIDVLTGMKVYSGDNGNFKPAATITRAEVAALIYRLATGDVDDSQANLYAAYGNFPDVRHDAWYAGYVGYCANAGYIKGRSNGNFDPSGNVTGYEALAMILRAIGYDKNGEFTGATWQTEVSALSQQLGILDNVKTTQYGGTLYLAARRDVVADLLFRADAFVPMVVYTPAFGYQPYGMVNGGSGNLIGSTQNPNPTLGQRIFGLTEKKNGILLGNEQTGEGAGKSVLGYANGKVKDTTTNKVVDLPATLSYSAYAFNGAPVYSNDGTTSIYTVNGNVTYTLKTNISLVGHKLRVWYDNGDGSASLTNNRVYAYFDEATLTDVVTTVDDNSQTNPTVVNATSDQYNDGDRNLYDLADAAGFKVNANTTAVFNNSFGKFGTLAAPATTIDEPALNNGDGVYSIGDDVALSPVKLYKLISNSSNKQLDAVIALNVESSQITESNTVNRVPTIGLPVQNWSAGEAASNTCSFFVEGDTGSVTTAGQDNVNLKNVAGTVTGVLAQSALVGDSAKTLGDYEMGIHITGTTRRTVSTTEQTAVNVVNTGSTPKEEFESSYFLLDKVEATVSGTVVAYNVAKGTVTLDNGTVLERSDFYHTVVGWNDAKPNNTSAPATAIPQGWTRGASVWEEGYANTTYKFYTDFEGKYLGAERTYGDTFLYGTYLDYSQETSSSTFNYFLTGVNMSGEVKTVQVKKYWAPDASETVYNAATSTTLTNITGTTNLGVPFRDSTSGGFNNGIGAGRYTGFAIQNDTADGIATDPYLDRNEYLNNMARLGIKIGNDGRDTIKNLQPTTRGDITIDRTAITLGAKETDNSPANGKYFTEATKFILVSGFGTDSVKAEVYNGISELKGTASSVVLNMDGVVNTDVTMRNIATGATMDQMTYFTESPYTYAQSGNTAMKIDTIILPKAAVSWAGGSGLYYVGDPNYTSINSWGTDAWKYNLYLDGELQQVWLTNDPNSFTYRLTNDVFLNLKDTGDKANDGQPIYTAGMYDPINGQWKAGTYFDNTTATWSSSTAVYDSSTPPRPQLGYMAQVEYSATTRDAQTATFGGSDSKIDSTNDILERVAGAKVVNLNAEANCIRRPTSGYVWPGVTDLATLNAAGSINPVTGRSLKVSAVVDPSNPLIVTCIYVCYEQ